jgi:hypothetical protein
MTHLMRLHVGSSSHLYPNIDIVVHEGEIEPATFQFVAQYHNPVAYPGILFGGVQQIELRREDKENGDLGAVAP